MADLVRDIEQVGRFELHRMPDGSEVYFEPVQHGYFAEVREKRVRAQYEEAVALEADEVLKQYEREEKRPPSEETRRQRAIQIVKRENPDLYGRYHGLRGSIETGQRWLSGKRASLSALQTLNKTGVQLSGVA